MTIKIFRLFGFIVFSRSCTFFNKQFQIKVTSIYSCITGNLHNQQCIFFLIKDTQIFDSSCFLLASISYLVQPAKQYKELKLGSRVRDAIPGKISFSFMCFTIQMGNIILNFACGMSIDQFLDLTNKKSDVFFKYSY